MLAANSCFTLFGEDMSCDCREISWIFSLNNKYNYYEKNNSSNINKNIRDNSNNKIENSKNVNNSSSSSKETQRQQLGITTTTAVLTNITTNSNNNYNNNVSTSSSSSDNAEFGFCRAVANITSVMMVLTGRYPERDVH